MISERHPIDNQHPLVEWAKILLPAIITGGIAVFAMKIDLVRLEEQMRAMKSQISTGILPGSQAAISDLRTEILVMETKNNAQFDSARARQTQTENRLVNITARLRNLERSVFGKVTTPTKDEDEAGTKN